MQGPLWPKCYCNNHPSLWYCSSVHQIFHLKEMNLLTESLVLTLVLSLLDIIEASPPYSFPAGSLICSQFQVTLMGPGSLQNSVLISTSRPITPDTSLRVEVIWGGPVMSRVMASLCSSRLLLPILLLATHLYSTNRLYTLYTCTAHYTPVQPLVRIPSVLNLQDGGVTPPPDLPTPRELLQPLIAWARHGVSRAAQTSSVIISWWPHPHCERKTSYLLWRPTVAADTGLVTRLSGPSENKEAWDEEDNRAR